jgi:CheY-like chemotaxis protein
MINLEKALSGRRILIVDDLVEARSSLKRMATILGGDNIDVATDGIEAMNLIHENEYDIVLADYNLGQTKDGQQILEEARFTQRLRSTAILFRNTRKKTTTTTSCFSYSWPITHASKKIPTSFKRLFTTIK